jgi:hypothetical protein
MSTRWIRIGLAALVLGLAAGHPAEAIEGTGSGRGGACAVMAFATFGVDSGGDEVSITSTSPVDIIQTSLTLPCDGPVVATFFAQAATTSVNYSSIYLVAECVVPSTPGGCQPGTTTHTQPRGTSFGGPDRQLFQIGTQGLGPASVIGVFPALPRGTYTFKAQGDVQVGGFLQIQDRALVIQAYGTPPSSSAR